MTANKQLTGDALYLRQKNETNFTAPFIICDGLQTPENLGSILRVADAAGSKGIILLDSALDLSSKKISKLSRSSNKHITIMQLSLVDFIQSEKNRFKKIYALEITTESKSLFSADITDCDAIVLGHESRGIRQELLLLCKQSIHLPMYGVNGSMNISHALSIFLYEWRRQKS